MGPPAGEHAAEEWVVEGGDGDGGVEGGDEFLRGGVEAAGGCNRFS